MIEIVEYANQKVWAIYPATANVGSGLPMEIQ